MMPNGITATLLLCLTSVPFFETIKGERWSRQITNADGHSQEAPGEWIPLAAPLQESQQQSHPVEETARSLNSRVLHYGPQNQNVPNIYGNVISDPQQSRYSVGQPFQRINSNTQFSLPQPQKSHSHNHRVPSNGGSDSGTHQQQRQHQKNFQHQEPTSQSFFKFEMPFFGRANNHNNGNNNGDIPRNENLPAVQTGYHIHHTFPQHQQPQQPLLTSPLFNQKQSFPPEFAPGSSLSLTPPALPHSEALVQQKPIQKNYPSKQKTSVDDNKLQQTQNSYAIHSTTPFPTNENFEIVRPTSFQAQLPFHGLPQLQGQLPPEEVQLLYVPYDTLYQNKPEQVFDGNRYNVIPPPVNPVQINSFYTPESLINQDPHLFSTPSSTSGHFGTSTTTTRPSVTYQNYNQPRFTSSPSSKPKTKVKPHQPPLSLFMQKSFNKPNSASDVVQSLANAKSIAVVDAPTKSAPSIFIGPAGMTPPNGFAKFDLPYLSTLDQRKLENNFNEIPFFVAPLSYRAQSGFNKIVLPEPHVGSIVINRPFLDFNGNYVKPVGGKGSNVQNQQQQYYQPQKQVYLTSPGGNDISHHHHHHPNTPRTKVASSTNIPHSTRNRYNSFNPSETSTAPTSKDYYRGGQYQQGSRPQVSSTKPTVTTSKRPIDSVRQNYQRPSSTEENRQTLFSDFKPVSNKVVNEEYFKVSPIKSSTLSPSVLDVSIQTTEPTPYVQTYLNKSPYSTNPSVDIVNENIYGNSQYNVQPNSASNPQYQLSSTSPPYYSNIKGNDEHQMKNYYRQQEAYKNRPNFPTTTPKTIYESIEYTPVSVDYDKKLYGSPTTPSYFDGSTLKTTTKEKFTFYTPAIQEFNVNEHKSDQSTKESHTTPSTQRYQETFKELSVTTNPSVITKEQSQLDNTEDSRLSNHRTTYKNEIVYNHDDRPVELEQELEYEPNPYPVPSELPSLTPNLPGLVNELLDKNKLKNKTEDEFLLTTTTEPPSSSVIASRKPIQRGKRPPITKVSSSVSYSSSVDTSTRRTVLRGRRPYIPRNNNSTTKSTGSESASTTTTRSPISRNPNRVRYTPTAEERQRIRQRVRGQTQKKITNKGEEDNLEYQRDVLKQNYPVFKPSTKGTTTRGTTPAATELSEKGSASEDVITVTPTTASDNGNLFPSILEPMQIAQEYQQLAGDNYGPGYFPNEELPITEQPHLQNEIQSSYVTTTEAQKEISRRPSFIRRGPRPTKATTTESPIVTTTEEERFTVRPRVRSENSHRPRVVKIRGRTRKPHPASTSTTAPNAERKSTSTENGYHKLKKFNQDFYQEEQKNSPHRKHNKNSNGNFKLETQESQWSPSLINNNEGFKPFDPAEKAKFFKEQSQKFENEPEIVTVSSGSFGADVKRQDTFLFNVSAGFPSNPSEVSSTTTVNAFESTRISNKSEDRKRTTETTFANLLEEVMSGVEKEYKNRNHNSGATAPVPQQHTKRRGVWKKIRLPNQNHRPSSSTQNGESFETAESQNLGTQIYNSIYENEHGTKVDSAKEPTGIDSVITTTPSSLQQATVTSVPESETTPAPTETANAHNFKSRNDGEVNTESIITTTDQPIDESKDGVTSTMKSYFNENSDSSTDVITRRIDEFSRHDDNYHTKVAISDNDDIPETNEDDLESQPSLFDEVRKQLSDLFAVNDEDDDDPIAAKIHPRRQEYTSIQRIRAVTENPKKDDSDKGEDKQNNMGKDDEEEDGKVSSVTTSPFHKRLMDSVVYATSTSTEVSQETEICYRGRCVKALKQL